jgi:hypothetical protein
MFSIPTITGIEVDDAPAADDAENLIRTLTEELDVAFKLIEVENRMFLRLKAMILDLETVIRNTFNGSFHEGIEGESFFDELEDYRSASCLDDQQRVQQRYIAQNCYVCITRIILRVSTKLGRCLAYVRDHV